MILDSFLLNAPTIEEAEDDMIPETTWKSLIETTFHIPYHNLLMMEQDLMISTGIQEELLKLDENSVCILYIGFIIILINLYIYI